MIHVRIELWPKGDKSRARLLGEARIWNTGQGTPTRGKYSFLLTGKRGMPMGHGNVNEFPRKQLMAWDLLRWVLNAARHNKQDVIL